MRRGTQSLHNFHSVSTNLSRVSRAKRLAFGLAAVFASCFFIFGTTAAAQSESQVLRVKVDLQPIDVQVKDAQGNNVSGLSAGDFTLLENGKPQKIAFFGVGNDPVSLSVLVDSSSSMNPNDRLGSAQAIAAQFMRTARPGDEISAMDFTDQMGPFRQLSREQALSPSAAALPSVPSGGSALYDAIATALCHLQASKNLRQAVVVITDGIDQHSRITLEQLIGLVRSSRAQLFMIGLESRPELDFEGHVEPRLTLVSGRDIDNPVVVFDRLMKESGAESFIPNSERSLEDALKAVSDTLQAQYTLAYYPEGTSKKVRRITVEVKRKGVRVMARGFVGSDPEAGESVHFEKGTCSVSPELHPYPYESELTHGPGGLVYKEDFSNPLSGWPDHENSRYVSGGYELSNPKPKLRSPSLPMKAGSMVGEAMSIELQENAIAAYGPWWSDFRASVNVNAAIPAPNGAEAQAPYEHQPAVGLVFRLNQQGYYALLLTGSRGAKESAVKLVKREFRNSAEMEILPWTRIVNQATTSGTELSVEAVGDQITLFVNGQRVKQLKDDSYYQGYVGFTVSGPARAVFQDLVVEQK